MSNTKPILLNPHNQSASIREQIKNSPEGAALISKAQVPDERRKALGDEESIIADLQKISRLSANRKISNKLTLKLLPEIKKCNELVVGLILAPDDLANTAMTISGSVKYLPIEVNTSIIGEVKSHFEETYKIADKITSWIYDSLCMDGAKPILVLPENAIDYAINKGVPDVAMQSFSNELDNGLFKSTGHLGSPYVLKNKSQFGRVSLQSINDFGSYSPKSEAELTYISNDTNGQPIVKTLPDSYITVTDNINAFKLPLFNNFMQRKRAERHGIDVTLQGYWNDQQTRESEFKTMERLINKRRNYENKPVDRFWSQMDIPRYSIGHPLVLEPSTVCCLPVMSTAEKGRPIGAYILLDGMGNLVDETIIAPFSSTDTSPTCDQSGMYGTYNTNLWRTLREQTSYKGDTPDANITKRLESVWTNIFSSDLTRRLINGGYSSGVRLANNTDFYRVSLSMAWAKQETMAVFVPYEYFIYMAYEYDEYGLGISLMTSGSQIAAYRSALTVLGMLNSARAAIPAKEMTITCDPNDKDLAKTIAEWQEIYKATNSAALPPEQLTDMSLITQWASNNSLSVKLANVPDSYPNEQAEVRDIPYEIKPLDETYIDNLKKQHYAIWGLTPENIDATPESNFATSLIQNNRLLAKRTANWQRITGMHMTDFIRKYVYADGKLLEKIRNILKDNYDEIWDSIVRHATNDVTDELGELQPYIREHENIFKLADGGKDSEASKSLMNRVIDTITKQWINSLSYDFLLNDRIGYTQRTEMITDYAKFVTTVLDNVILPPNLLPEQILEQTGIDPDHFKAMVQYALVSDYVAEHNLIGEFDDIVVMAGEGLDKYDIKARIEPLLRRLGISLLDVRNAINETATALTAVAKNTNIAELSSSEETDTPSKITDSDNPTGDFDSDIDFGNDGDEIPGL